MIKMMINCNNNSNNDKCYNDQGFEISVIIDQLELKNSSKWSYCAPAIANCEPIEGHSCSNRSWVYLRGGFTYSGCHNKVISTASKETDSCGNEIGRKAWVYCNEKPTTMVDTNADHRFYVYTGDDYLCPRGGSIVSSNECTKASNWVYDNLGLKHVAKNQTAFTSGDSSRCFSIATLHNPGCFYRWRKSILTLVPYKLLKIGVNDNISGKKYQSNTKLIFNNNYRSYAYKDDKQWSGGTNHQKLCKYRLLCKGTCNNCDPSLPASNTNSCNHANNKYPNCKN